MKHIENKSGKNFGQIEKNIQKRKNEISVGWRKTTFHCFTNVQCLTLLGTGLEGRNRHQTSMYIYE